jgi:hypothetical protein
MAADAEPGTKAGTVSGSWLSLRMPSCSTRRHSVSKLPESARMPSQVSCTKS